MVRGGCGGDIVLLWTIATAVADAGGETVFCRIVAVAVVVGGGGGGTPAPRADTRSMLLAM